MRNSTTPQAALAGLISGPLSDREDYRWNVLVQWWPRTGYTLADLKQALRDAVAAGHLALHGDEIEASYRLLPLGRAALYERHSPRLPTWAWSAVSSV